MASQGGSELAKRGGQLKRWRMAGLRLQAVGGSPRWAGAQVGLRRGGLQGSRGRGPDCYEIWTAQKARPRAGPHPAERGLAGLAGGLDVRERRWGQRVTGRAKAGMGGDGDSEGAGRPPWADPEERDTGCGAVLHQGCRLLSPFSEDVGTPAPQAAGAMQCSV